MARKYLAFILLLALCSCSRQKHVLNIYFAGDLLLDRGVKKEIDKNGVASLFRNVAPAFASTDAVIANLECPIADNSAPVNKRYIFNGKASYLKPIRAAGITHLIMANNHTYDQGRQGIIETVANLNKNNITPIGYGNSQENACKPVTIKKDEITVAIFATVLLALENWAHLPDAPGVCQMSVNELVNEIRFYKTTHPTDKVIVSLHWGAEFQQTPTPYQRKQAHELVDAGADAIVGHHPHVIQPLEVYNGKPIFYSIGNFIFDQSYLPATKGLIVKLAFTEASDSFSNQAFTIRNCTPSFD